MYESSNIPHNEDSHYLDSNSPYFGVASMKVFSENLCEFYAKLGKTKYTAIRHSNIFGPYDKFDLDKCHLVPAMIRKVLEQDAIQVIGAKDNEARRDILYIDDLINFIDLCIQKQTNNYELLNCGYEKAFSVTEIIDAIQNIAGTDKSIIYNDNKKNIATCTILDCSKARKLLNWYPKTSVQVGLRQTIEYYKNEIQSKQ